MAQRARAPRSPDPAYDTAYNTAYDTADRLHSAAIHLLRRVRREDDSTGLPAPQASALSVIVFRGPLTLSALAQAEQVRAPSITRIVAALEERALVVREPDERDRRITFVRATARGRAVLEKARGKRIAVIATDIAQLPPADLGRLRDALDVLERVVGSRH